MSVNGRDDEMKNRFRSGKIISILDSNVLEIDMNFSAIKINAMRTNHLAMLNRLITPY